jgi:hypothetical protein
MAPEQIAGGSADQRADVYAAGVMLYELLTLRLPFSGDRRALEYAHLSFRPPPPSRIGGASPPVDEVVLRCLAKDPAARFPDATAVLLAFTAATGIPAAAGDAPVAAPRPASAAPVDRQRVALLFIHQPGLAAADLQAAVRCFGGQLAHIEKDRAACAFTHQAGEHPGQRALAAARALVASGLARRLVVDLAPVRIRSRPDGSARILSPAFADLARYPAASDPEGITIAPDARETLVHQDHTRTGDDEPPPLQGRDDDMAALLAEAESALAQRRPRVATVLAEAGIGKTRLMAELARRLRASDEVEVISLRAREPLGSDADEPLAALLRRGLDLDPGGLEQLRERLDGDDQQAVAAAVVLGWLSPRASEVVSLGVAPGVLRASVARAGRAALQRLAARRPLVVLIDDAHFADDALLEALEQSTVSELPLWVCAFARPAFSGSRPGWGQRAAHHHGRRLEALDGPAATELCRALLAPARPVPEPVAAALVERSGGVPLRLSELVRALRSRGLVRQRSGGVWQVASEVLDQLTDSPLFEWLATSQLEQLPAELRAHAQLLSLLTPEFSGEEVAGVLAAMDLQLAEDFPLDARVGTDRLCHAGLLERRPGGRHAFRSDVMREAVAATVTEALARGIHAAALIYHRSSAAPASHRLVRLARHAAACGNRAEASTAYLDCAESARARHAYLEADLFYTRALAQLDDDDQARRMQAFAGRGIVRYRMARHDDSLVDLAQARALAIAVGDPITQAHVMLDEAMALDWLLEWQRSRTLAEAARDLVGDQPDSLLQARVLMALGRSLHRFSCDREAAPVLRQAVQMAQAAGDAGYEDQVAAELLLGFLLPFIGLPDEAEQRLQNVERLCRRKGDEMHLAAMWNNRSCLWVARNDRQRFLEDSARVHEYARRMGNIGFERNANLNSAGFLHWRAEHEAALPFARRAIEIDQRYFRQGSFRPDGAVLLARISWSLGDREGARKLVEEVRGHQVAARAENKLDSLLPPNEVMLLDMSALLVEDGSAADWEALVTRAREVAQGQELIEVLEYAGLAALEHGDRPAAARWWREALAVDIPNIFAERIAGRLRELGS